MLQNECTTIANHLLSPLKISELSTYLEGTFAICLGRPVTLGEQGSGVSPCDGLGGFFGQHGWVVQDGRGCAELEQTAQHHCKHERTRRSMHNPEECTILQDLLQGFNILWMERWIKIRHSHRSLLIQKQETFLSFTHWVGAPGGNSNDRATAVWSDTALPCCRSTPFDWTNQRGAWRLRWTGTDWGQDSITAAPECNKDEGLKCELFCRRIQSRTSSSEACGPLHSRWTLACSRSDGV